MSIDAVTDASTGIRLYDFRRPTKLSRDHIRVYEIALETFARQWTTLLTTSLRVVSTVSLRGVAQVTYDEYVSSLPPTTVMMVLNVEPMNGAGILQVSLDNAMTMVDHLLGGHGRPPQPKRPLTEIESVLVRGLVERVLHELGYALESLVPLNAEITTIEHNPQFAQAASPSDLMVAASFDVRVGVDECVATLCLPFNGLFAHLERAINGSVNGRDRGGREAALRAVTARLNDVPVEVGVRFQSTVIALAEVVGLQPGDVVRLAHPLGRPLGVTADGVTFAHAVMGSEGRRMACLVVHPPEESA